MTNGADSDTVENVARQINAWYQSGASPARHFSRMALKACIRVIVAALVMTDEASSLSEPFRRVLLSTERGIEESTWKLTPRDIRLRTKEIWSIRKLTLRGGKQEGVDIVVINNGRLSITVVPTRGMSVARVDLGDVKLGWDSPVKELVHPQFINLQNRGGLGWLEGFNEWMVRCGLEFAGHPGQDKFTNNVGEEAQMDLTLHGKIGNIPASEVVILIDRDPPNRLRVRGRVDERMFYGPKLELWTEISTELGSTSFKIEDRITNRGATEQEFQLIYHGNYGPPLLGKDAEFLGPIRRVTPFNAHAAKSVKSYHQYEGPTPGFIEQVYCLYPYADAQGLTMVMLRNPAKNRSVSMQFSVSELPCFTLWKNSNALEEGYVTGLEPGTGFPYNRRIERSLGRVPKLAPGQSRNFTLSFTVQTSAAEVLRASEEIERIRNGREVEMDAEPPPTLR